MTANDAATLLRTYADALEAEHPAPADQTDLARLIVTLDDAPVAPLDLSFDGSPAPRRIGVLTAVALGLAAALALLVGYALLNDDSDVRTAGIPDGGGGLGFVFEGETVIREDPLVVIANQPIEPTFDTSELGDRIVYRSPFDVDESEIDAAVDELVDQVQQVFAEPRGTESEIQKVAIYGFTAERPISAVVADFPISFFEPDERGGRTRLLSLCTGDGGCSLDLARLDPDEDLSAMRSPSTYAEHIERTGVPGFSFAGAGTDGAGEATVLLETSRDIAVVQITTDDQQVWTVPIDGLAVLSVNATETTPLEIVTYDTQGAEVSRQTMAIDPSQ